MGHCHNDRNHLKQTGRDCNDRNHQTKGKDEDVTNRIGAIYAGNSN